MSIFIRREINAMIKKVPFSCFTRQHRGKRRHFYSAWKVFSKSCFFGHRFHPIGVDQRPIRREKVAFWNGKTCGRGLNRGTSPSTGKAVILQNQKWFEWFLANCIIKNETTSNKINFTSPLFILRSSVHHYLSYSSFCVGDRPQNWYFPLF